MLLSDISHGTKVLKENGIDGAPKSLFIIGIFGTYDKKNRNGRIYPRAVMSGEVQSYTESHISRRRSLGELGHPTNPNVNLERVSHLVVELKLKDNNIIHGKSKILPDTPYGLIATNLIN